LHQTQADGLAGCQWLAGKTSRIHF
jgi:hypothetical protein